MLPLIERDGVSIRICTGHGFGRCAPIPVPSGTLFADVGMTAGAELTFEVEHDERAIYPVSGDIRLNGVALPTDQLHVLETGAAPVISAASDAHVVLLGGEPLDGPRRMWWNFVSSSEQRIEQAKDAWRQQRFGTVPGESEWIPLPDR